MYQWKSGWNENGGGSGFDHHLKVSDVGETEPLDVNIRLAIWIQSNLGRDSSEMDTSEPWLFFVFILSWTNIQVDGRPWRVKLWRLTDINSYRAVLPRFTRLSVYFKPCAVIGCLSSTIDDDELDTAGITSMRVGLGLTMELKCELKRWKF